MSRLRRNPALRPSPWGKALQGQMLPVQNLSYMDLSDANLTNANLKGAHLYGADLTGANLTGANLKGATLWKANLANANLGKVYLDIADLTNVNLSNANLNGAILSRATAKGANFVDANLKGANLTGANLTGANLSGSNLEGANLGYANLEGANLTGANLTGANLNRANLKDANLTGVDLSKAMNVPPQKSNISRSGPLREHMQIEAPTSDSFKRWFGQSVVVGDEKKPVVVYHGTNKGGFTEFKPEKRDRHHNSFYVSDDIDVAETYVDRFEPSTRPDPALDNTAKSGIYRLYIRLLNPMIVEGEGKNWSKLDDPRAPRLHKTYELAQWAQDHGHDGVIFKNIVDDGGHRVRRSGKSTVYAVFDPKAIKSATGNNGNFDPSDADIRHNPQRPSRAPWRK